jgi:hypothetical protein
MVLTMLAIWIALAAPLTHKTYAQTGEIEWTEPINISNSPHLTSVDPFLLPDPAGGMHLFWAEKADVGAAQNPDTMMYAYWDGETWSKPIDIFFSPESDGNPIINYPYAAMDDNGRIHLIWLSEPNFPYYSLNYSSVEASQARFASAWQPKIVLADDSSGTQQSIHIAYSPPDTLHVIYSGGAQGDRPKEDRTVRYMRSTDLGETWSTPIDLFTSPVLSWGTSHTRILFEPPNNLYASWTLWDDTGNGYRVYFTRSQDGGSSWDTPIILAETRDDEYERDWNNMAQLDDNQLMTVWEGGWRAYRGAQFSYDGGASWSDPIDIFPRLIGDNGFVEFAKDSSGTWHSFLANRLREGVEQTGPASDDVSLWHSVWQGGTSWSDPTQAITGEPAKAMTDPAVAIVSGNRVVAAWYGSLIYEIYVATGVIKDAPAIPPVPWSPSVASVTHVPTEVVPSPAVVETIEPTQTPMIVKSVGDVQTDGTFVLIFGVVSSLIISLIMILMVVFKHRY